MRLPCALMTRAELDDERLDDTTWLVAITGELDSTSAIHLRRRVDAVLTAGQTKVVIDLTDLSHMDSSGLGELISCHQRAQGLEGGLALVVGSAPVRRTLEIRGVSQLFTIVASREQAVAALNRD